MKVKTKRQPPPVLVEPLIQFASDDPTPSVIAVPDGKGGTVFAPTSNRQAFDLAKEKEAK